MRVILTLVRKDFAVFFKDRAAVSLTFIVPFALIYLFGQIFGVNRKDTGPSGIRLAVVVQTQAAVAGQLVRALNTETAFRVVSDVALPDGSRRPLTEDDARAGLKADAYRFALILPADLVSPDRLGVRLRFLSNPRNDIETQTVNGLLQKTIFAQVPQLLGQSLQSSAQKLVGPAAFDRFNQALAANIGGTFGTDPAQVLASLRDGTFGLGAGTALPAATPTRNASGSPAAAAPAARPNVFSQLVKIEGEQVAGQNVTNPAATRLVGGWSVQFLLFAVSASAVALFRERDQGLFQRLLAAPVSRADILWSKFLYGVALGLVQLVTLFFAGRLLFGIDVTSHLGTLALVCIAAASACTAFGMLLASVSPTPDTARGLATFLILVMSALGGAWFPPSLMPEFIQQLGKFTLVYWSIEGFIQVLWAGATVRELLPTLAMLTGLTAVVMTLSVWRFNRGRLFE